MTLNKPIGPLTHKGLARAYILMGQLDQAQASYREFMSLWHEADAGNPILEEASLEYRQLGGAK